MLFLLIHFWFLRCNEFHNLSSLNNKSHENSMRSIESLCFKSRNFLSLNSFKNIIVSCWFFWITITFHISKRNLLLNQSWTSCEYFDKISSKTKIKTLPYIWLKGFNVTSESTRLIKLEVDWCSKVKFFL